MSRKFEEEIETDLGAEYETDPFLPRDVWWPMLSEHIRLTAASSLFDLTWLQEHDAALYSHIQLKKNGILNLGAVKRSKIINLAAQWLTSLEWAYYKKIGALDILIDENAYIIAIKVRDRAIGDTWVATPPITFEEGEALCGKEGEEIRNFWLGKLH